MDSALKKQKYIVLSLAILLFLSLLLVAFINNFREETQIQNGYNENLQWTISQSEIELLRFTNTIQRFAYNDPNIQHDDVVTRFDVLWSRIDLLLKGPVADAYKKISKGNAVAEKTMAILRHIEPLVMSLKRNEIDTYKKITSTFQGIDKQLHTKILNVAAYTSQTMQNRLDENHTTRKQLELLFASILISGGLFVILLVREMRTSNKLLSVSDQAKKEFLRIIQNSPTPMMLLSHDGRIEYLNNKFLDLFGWSQNDLLTSEEWWVAAYPNTCERMFIQESLDFVNEKLKYTDGRQAAQESWLTCKNGKRIYVEFKIMPISQNHTVISISDLTERMRAREDKRIRVAQLAHASRLSLIGELAASMAHELNQPLTAINTYAQTCIRELSQKEADNPQVILKDLYKISTQAQRAAEIIKWVRGFSLKQQEDRSFCDFNEIVHEAMFLSDLEILAPQVNVVYELSDNLPHVKIDKIQFQQAILNLAQNGIEAMATQENDNQTLILSTHQNENGDIEFAISDNGPGIETDQREQIFDLFFSTKAVGMGMGLAITKSILESHDSSLNVISSLGMGTTFTILIPTS